METIRRLIIVSRGEEGPLFQKTLKWAFIHGKPQGILISRKYLQQLSSILSLKNFSIKYPIEGFLLETYFIKRL